jgi:uncharacterized protein YecE (DUF72 family)
LQRPENFQRWFDETPDDFRFSIKGGRYITHMRRLREIKTPLANFFAQGLLRLGHKLGPILWQFPPGKFCAEAPQMFPGRPQIGDEHSLGCISKEGASLTFLNSLA